MHPGEGTSVKTQTTLAVVDGEEPQPEFQMRINPKSLDGQPVADKSQTAACEWTCVSHSFDKLFLTPAQ